jgi:hypothetical protein
MAGVGPPAASGRIFISYRPEETAYPAGWLYDRLADRFSGGQVFKDVDSIQLGDDFVEVVTRAVGSCDVLLALIGHQWLTITDEHGRRRLDDPDDFVRLEIEAALTRNVRVIPILVDGARMPHADELPDSLVKLVRRRRWSLVPPASSSIPAGCSMCSTGPWPTCGRHRTMGTSNSGRQGLYPEAESPTWWRLYEEIS